MPIILSSNWLVPNIQYLLMLSLLKPLQIKKILQLVALGDHICNHVPEKDDLVPNINCKTSTIQQSPGYIVQKRIWRRQY